MWHQFDTLSQDLRQQRNLQTGVIAGIALGTLAMSTVYVMWTLRTGYFLAALLASTPAWRYVDVLPILDFDEAQQKQRHRGRAPADHATWTGCGTEKSGVRCQVGGKCETLFRCWPRRCAAWDSALIVIHRFSPRRGSHMTAQGRA